MNLKEFLHVNFSPKRNEAGRYNSNNIFQNITEYYKNLLQTNLNCKIYIFQITKLVVSYMLIGRWWSMVNTEALANNKWMPTHATNIRFRGLFFLLLPQKSLWWIFVKLAFIVNHNSHKHRFVILLYKNTSFWTTSRTWRVNLAIFRIASNFCWRLFLYRSSNSSLKRYRRFALEESVVHRWMVIWI